MGTDFFSSKSGQQLGDMWVFLEGSNTFLKGGDGKMGHFLKEIVPTPQLRPQKNMFFWSQALTISTMKVRTYGPREGLLGSCVSIDTKRFHRMQR